MGAIHYCKLPHYFFEFDIYDKDAGQFLALEARLTVLEGTGIHTVPVIHRAAANADELRTLIGSSAFGSAFDNPIPPKLAMQLTSSNAVISWTPPWPGLVLEASESLSEPDWQPISSGQTNVVAVSLELPRCFFSLNPDALQGLCCAP